MLKKIILILAILYASSEAVAQKSVEKLWESNEIDTVLVASNLMSKIIVEAGSSADSITLNADVQGEYSESVLINHNIKQRTLTITSGFKPYHKPANDKLAAHKVLSVEVLLRIPSRIVVGIQSEIANVECSGRFSSVDIALGDGSCWLDDFIGNAQLFTMDGNIYAKVLQGVSGKAKSEFGDVENNLPPNGWYKVNAESKFGNIFLELAAFVKTE